MKEKPIEHCYWVIPGKFLAGEYPRNYDEDSSAAKVAALVDSGVTAFIDLTQDGELASYTHFLDPGKQVHLRFPIRDGRTPHDSQLTLSVLDAIDEHIEAGRVVYVHCHGGIGRTGTMVGCWLARHGEGGAPALGRLSELWEQCPKSEWTRSPETTAQCLYVINWKEGSGD